MVDLGKYLGESFFTFVKIENCREKNTCETHYEAPKTVLIMSIPSLILQQDKALIIEHAQYFYDTFCRGLIL